MNRHPLLIALIAALLLFGGVCIVGLYFAPPPEDVGDAADKVGAAADKVGGAAERLAALLNAVDDIVNFRPKVSLQNGPVVCESPKQVTEVVTAVQDSEREFCFTQTQFFFWKHIKVRGNFRTKVGFPVDDSFVLVVSEDGKSATLKHAPPILISCELVDAMEVVSRGDWWVYPITDDDRLQADKGLIAAAREAAMSQEILDLAVRNLNERFKKVEQEAGVTVTLEPLK